MDDVGTYDDDEAYAEGDPEWTDDQIVAAGKAIERLNDIDDPGEHYLASAGLLREMYGNDLVVP